MDGKVIFAFGLLGLSSLQLFQNIAIGSPWEFKCYYHDAKNATFKGTGRSMEEARKSASESCHREIDDYLNLRGENDRCIFKSCDEPTQCPPTNTGDLDLTRRGYECQIHKMNSQKAITVAKIDETIKAKILERKKDIRWIRFIEAKQVANAVKLHANEHSEAFKQLNEESLNYIKRFKNEYISSFDKNVEIIKKARELKNQNSQENIIAAQSSLETLSIHENSLALSFGSNARYLVSQIEDLCSLWNSKVSLLQEELKANNLEANIFDSVCKKTRASLNKCLSYTNSRKEKMDNNVSTVYLALQSRIDALRERNVDLQTRDSRMQAAHLNSSSLFLEHVINRTEELWSETKADKRFGLPFQEDVVRKIEAFAPLVMQCEKLDSGKSYMKTGCIEVKSNHDRAKLFLERTIPRNILFGLNVIIESSSDLMTDPLVEEIKKALGKKDISAAATYYDALLTREESKL